MWLVLSHRQFIRRVHMVTAVYTTCQYSIGGPSYYQFQVALKLTLVLVMRMTATCSSISYCVLGVFKLICHHCYNPAVIQSEFPQKRPSSRSSFGLYWQCYWHHRRHICSLCSLIVVLLEFVPFSDNVSSSLWLPRSLFLLVKKNNVTVTCVIPPSGRPTIPARYLTIWHAFFVMRLNTFATVVLSAYLQCLLWLNESQHSPHLSIIM